MSPTRSEYSNLVLELVSLEDNCSQRPKKPSMAEEKKNNGADDPINLLLEKALTRQRDEIMENFLLFLSLCFKAIKHTVKASVNDLKE
jgi:hypothetical protein